MDNRGRLPLEQLVNNCNLTAYLASGLPQRRPKVRKRVNSRVVPDASRPVFVPLCAIVVIIFDN
jgi:hypothetical protein